MLGRLRTERRWQWSACGKHPAAKDYFNVGDTFPLSKAFAEWMGRSFDTIDRKKAESAHPSWRFWTREIRHDHVVCGIIRDSGDAVGRPYPLLIMGAGPLADWDDHWDLIPFVCEQLWVQAEQAAARPWPDLAAFEGELRAIRPPTSRWSDLASRLTQFENFPLEALRERLRQLSDTDPFLCLDGQPYDHFDLIGVCHYLCRMNTKAIPNVVFMGGTVDHTYFAPFKRALSTADFARMWIAGDNEP